MNHNLFKRVIARLMGVFIILSILFVYLSIMSWQIPDTPEEELKWCMKNMPQFNDSSIPGIQTKYKVALGKVQQKCYTDHWAEYCKVSYLRDCPK